MSEKRSPRSTAGAGASTGADSRSAAGNAPAGARLAPPLLLPYQQAWLNDTAEVAVWEKSRRIGASYVDALAAVLCAAMEGGQDALYIGYSEDMTREYVDDCAMWAKAMQVAAGWMGECVYTDEGEDIKAFRIDFASGHKVLALSSRPRSIRGKQGRVTIDEAAFHDDLPGLLKAALAMLIWGGRVRVLSSHNGNSNPFNELVESIRAGRLPYSVHRTTFRQAVADGLYERVRLVQGDRMVERNEAEWVARIYALYRETAAEELDVIPSEGGGVFLPLALLMARMAAPEDRMTLVRRRWPASFSEVAEGLRRLEVEAWCDDELAPALAAMDAGCWHGLGEDFARSGDLTAIVVLEEGPDLVRRVRLVVELGNCPFAQQEQILCYVADRLPRLRRGALDAGGNGAALAEAAADRYGSGRIDQIKLTESFYREQMPRFKAALEDGHLAGLPRDDACRDDLRALRWINGVPKLPSAPTQRAGDGAAGGAQRHGDFAIALFLADYALRAEGFPGRCDGFRSASLPDDDAANEGWDEGLSLLVA